MEDRLMNRMIIAAAAVLVTATTMSAGADKGAAPEPPPPTVVKLVETPGSFDPRSLDLPAGKYVFLVTNQGVDHPVDFLLKLTKSEDLNQDPSDRTVRNSRLSHHVANGETAGTDVVELKPGTYTYSSTLNPTPEFTLTAR